MNLDLVGYAVSAEQLRRRTRRRAEALGGGSPMIHSLLGRSPDSAGSLRILLPTSDHNW